MAYQLRIPKPVRQQIDGLPGHIKQRVRRIIAGLAMDPRPQEAVAMRRNLAGRYKIKVDQYRIVYKVEDDVLTVEVLKAGKKRPGFYDDVA